MTVAVLRFPGSNCDDDCLHAVDALGGTAKYVWHTEEVFPDDVTGVIVPGGFSYGDYLRTGAIAAQSPVIKSLRRFADQGGPVLGICNGFQILCELGLIPGALSSNASGRFVCRWVELEVVSRRGPILKNLPATVRFPVAHGAGRYIAGDGGADALQQKEHIAFTYVEKDDEGRGLINGSDAGIAGVVGGQNANIVGLMPHPERAAEERLGGTDGAPMLRALMGGGHV